MVRINHNKPIEKCESYVRVNLKILLKEENQGLGLVGSQYAHDVVLTSVRRRFNVMDVVWTSKATSCAYWDTLYCLSWIFF